MRRFFGAAGSVSRLILKSEVLGTNILGDPTSRAVDVYIPAGHDGRGLPLLVDLVGITSSGLSQTNWMAFGENMPERLDRLIGEERMAPVVVAFPDCFTRIGGNQYINSAATGPWEDFLIAEMLPAIEGRFGCGGSGRRGVFGIDECLRQQERDTSARRLHRATRRVQQELGRIWGDHERTAPF